LYTHPFFKLNCCLCLGKGQKLIGRASPKIECFLEQASDASYVNLYGVQLFLEIGIMVSMFFIFHVSLVMISLIDSGRWLRTGNWLYMMVLVAL
jgi:hypothetical protein